jgi:asparagine synthase (glutamine-hydrolysing)
MCGINGFIDWGNQLGEADLKRSTNVIGHRGPDDSGHEVYRAGSATIGFGHRRLSILDLSPLGHQPMADSTGQHIVVFNGEVYNFSDVRRPLEASGISFRSHSDTEAIIYSFRENGLASLKDFIGMFAIAYYDRNKEKVYLIRDRAGVKPLYYARFGDKLLFSSELKSFHQYDFFVKNINANAVNLFMRYGYIPAPHTIFENTFKLLPGHYLEIDLRTRTAEQHKYWDVYDYYNKPKLKISEEEVIEETDKLLHSAFNYRMVSDVPVGVFFSGGYDSSLVAAILQSDATEKIKTFTIGFNEKHFNEAPHAKKIADYLGTDHHEYYCTQKEAADILPELPFFYDEPFGDASAIPTILVSRMARRQVTVALSADAGDEIFGGYNRYGYLRKIQETFRRFPSFLSGFTSGLMRSINISAIPYVKDRPGIVNRYKMMSDVIHTKDIFQQNDILLSRYKKGQVERMLSGRDYPGTTTYFDSLLLLNNENDDFSKILALDFKTYLPDDIMVKVDRATMSVALEGREPLLDHRIIEWAAQLPIDMKIRGGEKKYILKKIAHRYIPAELLERPKMGFGIPVLIWFRDELKTLIYEYLGEEALNKNDFLDTRYVLQLRDAFMKNPSDDEASKIWLPLMFQMWWKKWMD